jgi:hypothetical protein
MKKAIHSLLGIEISIGNYEFKPILLCCSVLSFILLVIPLVLVYCCIYLKSTLVEGISYIKKERKLYYKDKFKWL